MKTINTVLTVSGFFMIAALPMAVMAGSFTLFVIGCLGFAVFMRGIIKEA